MSKERTYGIDLARTVAICFVLAVHSLLHTSFYSEPLQGLPMAIGCIARTAFVGAVPMFLTLTGFLCINRTVEKGYFRKLFPVLIIYLIASVACIVFRATRMDTIFTVKSGLSAILNYTGAPYGWYVEMYIGLFLITPFLNAGWKALDDRKKKILLACLIFMTALSPVINQAHHVLPDWWEEFYPVTYYFIGAWLREHPLTVKRRWLFLGWLGLAGAFGLLHYFAQQIVLPGQVYNNWGYNYRASILILAQTVCLFSFLRQFDGSRTPAALRWCVHRIAKITLPIHLISYIGDALFYSVLCNVLPTFAKRLPFLPLVILINLIFSALLGQLIDWATNALMKCIPQKNNHFATHI